jgi:hypothetical protein
VVSSHTIPLWLGPSALQHSNYFELFILCVFKIHIVFDCWGDFISIWSAADFGAAVELEVSLGFAAKTVQDARHFFAAYRLLPPSSPS